MGPIVARAVLVPALLALLLAAGCGQTGGSAGNFEGDEQAVADAVEALQEASADRDERRICRALLTTEVSRALGDCERTIGAVLDDADTYELVVQDVRLEGRDRARARVQSGGDEDRTRVITLAREGGGWRVADLGTPPRQS